MGIVKTKGIIIAESNMGDFDKMLTILTPGMGKIACAAKGARRQTSSWHTIFMFWRIHII